MMTFSSTAPPTKILAVDMLSPGASDLPLATVLLVNFSELDETLLARELPDLVMLPLLSPGHDATAVIERLESIGYRGLISVVALRLPDARMVEAELRALGPGKRLTVLTT